MIVLETIAVAFAMFSAVPVPQPEWNQRNMRYALCAFPLIGVVIGLAWWIWAATCSVLEFPALLRAAGFCLLPMAITGGIHLDGFADTSDALASCAPPERKQEILKDSHCGAFAVIGMVLLACGQWSVAMANPTVPLLPLLLIPVASRACAALAVLTLRPMESSQYAAMTGKKAPYTAFAALVLAASVMVPLAVWGSFAPLAAAAGYGAALWYAYRQLGGMSGDVSGFALTLGELCGRAVLTLVR